MSTQTPKPTKRQHYLPCCYLQFFSLQPKGRESVVWVFNGESCRDAKVESVGLQNYTYSQKDPATAERFFRFNFEDDYPRIAKRIIKGWTLNVQDRRDLFFFALITRFRSPAYVNKTNNERIDLLSYIAGSALNSIEPLTEMDWKPGKEFRHLNRTARKFALKVVKSPVRMWVSDNPAHIYKCDEVFWAVILLPISPTLTAVFYRPDMFVIKDELSPRDIKHLQVTQRDSRIHFLFHPCDISAACNPNMEEPAPNLSEVNDTKVNHHHPDLYDQSEEPIFDFIARKHLVT